MSADDLRDRRAPLEMSPEAFREAGHRLIDEIAAFLESLPRRPVTRDEAPSALRALLPAALEDEGAPPGDLLAETAPLLFDHSLFNGHPSFLGYITSSAAPIGALADLLAAAVNPNVGAWQLSPIASEIEGQCIRWLAGLLGMPAGSEGLLVSGGNMANFVCFLAARRAKAGEGVREAGVHRDGPRLLAYASTETHTWLQKATDLFGHGTASLRWIPVRDDLTIDVEALERRIEEDRREGHQPVPARRERGHGEHRRRRPARPAGRDRAKARPLVPRRRGLRRPRGGERRGSGRAGRAGRGRLGGLRPAQVALLAARGGLRPRAPPGRSPRRLQLLTPVLPLRRGEGGPAHELLRARPPELAGLPCPEGVAGPAAGGPPRPRPDDRRRHPPRPRAPPPRRRDPPARGVDPGPEHHDVSLRPGGPRAGDGGGGRLPQHAQRGAAPPPEGERRGLRVERRRSRDVPAPRLHRELPDDARPPRGAARDRRAPRRGGGPRPAPRAPSRGGLKLRT